DAVATADPLVRDAISFISAHLGESFGTSQIAARLGVSQDVLHDRFVAELGHAAGAEILRRRLAAAKRMLAATDLAAREIADRTGFSSPSHFSNAFRAATGLAPRAWRLRNGTAPLRVV
ncbi:MAG: helix-turn-helix transcriptional regulator, partial [Kiritimatiellae bacterium]|nr:helix-turn-helix transcriptional regulator [Kiritimatiellia bacterium]